MQVQITEVHSDGKEFSNLTPGSLHDIVRPPEKYEGAVRVWVKGADELPVMLFEDEFEFVGEFDLLRAKKDLPCNEIQ